VCFLYVIVLQVIQQQQLLRTHQSSVLFNPETQTKIIYRVVYPSGTASGGKSAQGKPRRSLDGADAENSREDFPTWATAAKRQRHRRTRSGRVCRPPQYMVKDYKEIHAVDYDAESGPVVGPGYSEFKEHSEGEADVDDEHVPSKAFDFDESVPIGK